MLDHFAEGHPLGGKGCQLRDQLSSSGDKKYSAPASAVLKKEISNRASEAWPLQDFYVQEIVERKECRAVG